LIGRRASRGPQARAASSLRGVSAPGVSPHPPNVHDDRPPERVARLQAGYFGDFEARVAFVVARLTGDQVVLQDDGTRDAMVDIRIEHVGAPESPSHMEVWTDHDEADAAMRSRLFMPERRLPQEWAAPELGRVWFVMISEATDLRQLRRHLRPILCELEDSEDLPARGQPFAQAAPTPAALARLGVVAIQSRPSEADEVHRIKLYPRGITGPADSSWTPFLSWSAHILASPRLSSHRDKLAATGSTQRHFVLGVTESSPGEVYFALARGSGLPPAEPELPDAITHLWVMDAVTGQRCIVWDPSRGWLDAQDNWVC
jgi:hypothetical protein